MKLLQSFSGLMHASYANLRGNLACFFLLDCYHWCARVFRFMILPLPVVDTTVLSSAPALYVSSWFPHLEYRHWYLKFSSQWLTEIPGVMFRIFLSDFTFTGRANLLIESRSNFVISPLLPFPHKSVGVGDIWLHRIQDTRSWNTPYTNAAHYAIQVFILVRGRDKMLAWSNVGPRLFQNLPVRYPSIFVRYSQLAWQWYGSQLTPFVGWASVKDVYGEMSRFKLYRLQSIQ